MRCTAFNKDGARCARAAMRGREVCHAHSGAPVGRPSALTPEAHEKIVQLVKVGCPGEIAAQAAGMSPSTYYELKRQGREEDSGPRCELLDAVELARAEAYGHCMANWRREMGRPGNWRANVAWIDRFDRGRFDDGGADRGESNGGSAGGPSTGERRLEVAQLSEEQLAFLEGLYDDADGEGEEA